ncbi:MAG: PAS-domain containing protein, partial [Pseudolabrys sp.]|nr:PAS-domain containing protein [Pseudolabrys sp.]
MPELMSWNFAALLALLSVGLIVALAALNRLRSHYRRLSRAIDNMSQGLCMFDEQGRITLVNHRYIEMYKLDPKIVKPGLTLRGLIQHRKDTGLFSGDVDSYVQKIMESMTSGTGKSLGQLVQASDGRVVMARNERLPDGGWVST